MPALPPTAGIPLARLPTGTLEAGGRALTSCKCLFPRQQLKSTLAGLPSSKIEASGSALTSCKCPLCRQKLKSPLASLLQAHLKQAVAPLHPANARSAASSWNPPRKVATGTLEASGRTLTSFKCLFCRQQLKSPLASLPSSKIEAGGSTLAS